MSATKSQKILYQKFLKCFKSKVTKGELWIFIQLEITSYQEQSVPPRHRLRPNRVNIATYLKVCWASGSPKEPSTFRKYMRSWATMCILSMSAEVNWPFGRCCILSNNDKVAASLIVSINLFCGIGKKYKQL